VKLSNSKYNGKYLLRNLLVCNCCGTSYRRRTERRKVVWRYGTRIEKGGRSCDNLPALDEEWIRETLIKEICQNGVYDERIIRNEVD